MDSTKEIVGLLYISLATAAGGRKLLDDSNKIVRKALDAGAVGNVDARRTLQALLASTASEAA
jgi:hypothetical protein